MKVYIYTTCFTSYQLFFYFET